MWKHVDFDKGWLRLEPGEGKTGEGPMFPFIDELRALFAAHRERVSQIEQIRRQFEDAHAVLDRKCPQISQAPGKPA
jgi:hypothetical protein